VQVFPPMTSGAPTPIPAGMTVPKHIAIIMDGNGRWARERGLARIRGHEEGAESVRTVLRTCGEQGVQYLTLYAFSTENWKRPKAEVAALMKLLQRFLRKEAPELMDQNVRLQAIGRLTDLPESCQKELHRVIELTAGNSGTTLILALSYSGRLEIIDAVRSLVRDVKAGHLDEAMIDPDAFSKHLYTRYYPDPDLLIRTSGEMRISNFLLWQLSYTEIYVTKKLWPDFRKPDLLAAIEDYSKRQRRYGGL
jgi:undecaprenyl diphosphate synthase